MSKMSKILYSNGLIFSKKDERLGDSHVITIPWAHVMWGGRPTPHSPRGVARAVVAIWEMALALLKGTLSQAIRVLLYNQIPSRRLLRKRKEML